jgi:hypothetical protein
VECVWVAYLDGDPVCAPLAQVLDQHGVEGDLLEEGADAALVVVGVEEEAVPVLVRLDAVNVLGGQAARDVQPAERHPLETCHNHNHVSRQARPRSPVRDLLSPSIHQVVCACLSLQLATCPIVSAD